MTKGHVYQTEITELKNSVNEIKTALGSISGRVNQAESVRLKTGTLKLQSEENKEKTLTFSKKAFDTYGIPKGQICESAEF